MQKKWMAVLLSMTFIGNSVISTHAAELQTEPVTQEPTNEHNEEEIPSELPEIDLENLEIEEPPLSTPPSLTNQSISDEAATPDAEFDIPSEPSSEIISSDSLSDGVIPSEPEEISSILSPEGGETEETAETAVIQEEIELDQEDILMLYDKEEVQQEGIMKMRKILKYLLMV